MLSRASCIFNIWVKLKGSLKRHELGIDFINLGNTHQAVSNLV
jgi:hypothetical protein